MNLHSFTFICVHHILIFFFFFYVIYFEFFIIYIFCFDLTCKKLRQTTSTAAATSTASTPATLKIVEIPFTFQHAIRSGL